MTNTNFEEGFPQEDIWEKFVDLDEQIFINENILEIKTRGRAFSTKNREKL